MQKIITDTAGLGTGLWLFGYLLSLALFFSPLAGIMGWILLAACTPITVAVAWWWFRGRNLPLPYYVMVGVAWTAIAALLDWLFIVLLFWPRTTASTCSCTTLSRFSSRWGSAWC